MITKYQTIVIRNNSNYPRESTQQEKMLVDWAEALEYTGGPQEIVSKIYFWHNTLDVSQPVVMTFNYEGAAPTFRGETEAECLEVAIMRLKKKHDELSAKQTASQIAFDILQQKWND
jgi:hypothetical protein